MDCATGPLEGNFNISASASVKLDEFNDAVRESAKFKFVENEASAQPGDIVAGQDFSIGALRRASRENRIRVLALIVATLVEDELEIDLDPEPWRLQLGREIAIFRQEVGRHCAVVVEPDATRPSVNQMFVWMRELGAFDWINLADRETLRAEIAKAEGDVTAAESCVAQAQQFRYEAGREYLIAQQLHRDPLLAPGSVRRIGARTRERGACTSTRTRGSRRDRVAGKSGDDPPDGESEPPRGRPSKFSAVLS